MESRNRFARMATAFLLNLALTAGLQAEKTTSATQQGLSLLDQGRYREAEQFLLQASKVDGGANATIIYNLASLYQKQGRLIEAERLHRRALQEIERIRGPVDPAVAQSLNDLGALYRSLARYSKAMDVLERAVQILDQNPPQKFACSVLDNLANTFYDLGQSDKADALVERALAIIESGNFEDPSDRGYVLSTLSRGYVLRQRYAEAEAAARQAVSTFAVTLGLQHPDYALALTKLAIVYQRQGRSREALPILEAGIAGLQRSFGAEAPILADALYRYAEVVKSLGRSSEAREISRRAKSIAPPPIGTVDIKALSRKR